MKDIKVIKNIYITLFPYSTFHSYQWDEVSQKIREEFPKYKCQKYEKILMVMKRLILNIEVNKLDTFISLHSEINKAFETAYNNIYFFHDLH